MGFGPRACVRSVSYGSIGKRREMDVRVPEVETGSAEISGEFSAKTTPQM